MSAFIADGDAKAYAARQGKGGGLWQKTKEKNYGIFSVVPYVPSDELK